MAVGDIKKTFAKNLSNLLASSGVTQAELADRMNVAASSVSGWCTGAKMPRMDKVEWICSHFGVSRSALLEESSVSIPPGFIPMPKMKKVPLVGTIACGVPILAEENIEGEIEVPANVNADFALRCKGDSMIGAGIFDGDLVYIKDTCEQPRNGQIAAVRIDNEATLKRFYRYDDIVQLVAENPAVPPLIFRCEEINELEIEGIAVAFMRYLKY